MAEFVPVMLNVNYSRMSNNLEGRDADDHVHKFYRLSTL